MKQINHRAHIKRAGGVILALVLAFAAGCKHQPAPPSDQQITTDIQAKIQGEGALNGQNIQVAVLNGVATLSGTVTDEASRALAGNDSGTVNGVKTVVNNLMVQPPQQTMVPAPQPSEPVPAQRSASARRRHEDRKHDEQPAPAPLPPPQVADVISSPPPQAPPPPPRPTQAGSQAGHTARGHGSPDQNHRDARQQNDANQRRLSRRIGQRHRQPGRDRHPAWHSGDRARC